MIEEFIWEERARTNKKFEELNKTVDYLINSMPISNKVKEAIRVFLENTNEIKKCDTETYDWYFVAVDKRDYVSVVKEKYSDHYFVVLSTECTFDKEYLQLPLKLGKALLTKAQIAHLSEGPNNNGDVDKVIEEYVGSLTPKKRKR